MQNVLKAVVPLVWAVLPSLAHGLTLDLPAPVLGEESRSETPGSYALPLEGFDGATVPAKTVEGALEQRVFQLEAPDLTTLAVMDPLRSQIAAAGFQVLLDCETEGCGGFDFRFGTDVMPEPDMHVDLGDFRFLSAEKGEEAISVLVSRSATTGYVQITRVSPAALPAAPVGETVDLEVEVVRGLPAPVAGGIGAALDDGGSVVLEDLVFASGSAALAEGDYASLAALAAWLEANPDGTLALVGHTDASGSLAANIALSERRAEAVAQALVEVHGVEAGRIAAEGVGFLAPRATNQTDEGRQKNRRVEAVVTSTR
ncbi:OmpA family protein [Tabrizicola aquatica]|uniref:OmpA family protein n=1 Tax=Tabrizicola aquatica TaxID=909926 RepID=UPI000CD24EC7|nr:OmpA family protein [Tabrizicola aquatica]